MRRPLVAVLLGTDHHAFDRLVALAESASETMNADWFVQHGYSTRPTLLPASPMLAVDELQDLLLRARAVVTHGGPGLIMEARAAGHVPVVVPRDPALHEHVDGHQLRFTERIARDGLIRRATTREEFDAALARALTTIPRQRSANATPSYSSARIGTLVDALRGDA